MLLPTIYMLQVFDRVMVSRSELTLLAVSAIALYLLGVLALTEWSRSRLLARLGAQLDSELSSQTFHAVYASHLSVHSQAHDASPSPAKRAFADLTELRQFIAGTGLLNWIDLPWALIFVVVLFLMHPLLGVVTLAFAGVQVVFHPLEPCVCAATHAPQQPVGCDRHTIFAKQAQRC